MGPLGSWPGNEATSSPAATSGPTIRTLRATFVQALRSVFEWAVEARLARIDPTAGVKLVRPKTEGFAVWTEDDISAFRHHWPLGTRERVAFEVLRATGLRRGDAVKVGRPHLRNGVIRINTEKTGERVAIAATDELLKAIAAGPIGELTFIAGQRGKPMVKEAFATWFHKACADAGLKGKSAHGIRKAAATADAEAGWTDAELDAKFGWTGRKMAAHYTRAASRERLSLAAAERTKNRTSIPAPEGQGAGESAENPTKSNAKK